MKTKTTPENHQTSYQDQPTMVEQEKETNRTVHCYWVLQLCYNILWSFWGNISYGLLGGRMNQVISILRYVTCTWYNLVASRFQSKMNSITASWFWIHSYNILRCVVCIYFGFRMNPNIDVDSLEHVHYDL